MQEKYKKQAITFDFGNFFMKKEKKMLNIFCLILFCYFFISLLQGTITHRLTSLNVKNVPGKKYGLCIFFK